MAEEPQLKLPDGVATAAELPRDRRKPEVEPFPQEQRAELLKVYGRHLVGRVERWLESGDGDTLVVPIGPPVIANAVVKRLVDHALAKGVALQHAPAGSITVTIVRE